MKPKKSLQKFTDSDKKIKEALNTEILTHDLVEKLSENERNKLFEIITEKLNTSTGEERDRIFKQIEGVICQSSKNQIWEANNTKITMGISRLLQEIGRMPSKQELAEETGLSRQTVHKHLKEYATHPLYLMEMEAFRFMTSKVLAKVFKFAVNGDIAAAKLYFQIVGFSNSLSPVNNTLIQNQNNFIQINGTVVSQEAVKNLNPEQLNMIETILKTAEASSK